MTIRIQPQVLTGNWRYGRALDLHTVSSTSLPGGGFNTQRSAIGEMLYQVKYHGDRSLLEPLAAVAADFVRSLLVFPYLKALLPVPPSKLDRPFQPVLEIAKLVADRTNLPFAHDYLSKVKATPALKSLTDATQRRELLQGAFAVKDESLAGKYVLLFDDLYRSGETLRAICDVLQGKGRIARVFVLTLTKTRIRR